MAKYQAYAEYKDSGVEWLGDVPKHWDTKSLKYLSTYNDEVLPESTNNNYQMEYVDIGSVNSVNGINKIETMCFRDSPSRARRIVQDGDVIISTVRTYLEAIAFLDRPSKNLIVSTGFAVIRPNKFLSKKYASYCLRANGFIKEVVARSVGVSYPAINSIELVNIKIPFLDVLEQTKISNFLDYETAKIDTLIAKQKKLIDLLKEKRQAVISHAVTKGLDPNVKMKASGVEWLGDVPEHWEVTYLKYYASIQGGYAFSSSLFTQEGIQVLRIANVYKNQLSLERQPIYIREKLMKNFKNFIISNNDILMSLTGTLGKRDYGFAIKIKNEQQYLLNQRLAKISSSNLKISNDFLINILWSEAYLTQLYSLPSGTKQANLSNDDVLGIKIAIPLNLQEQKNINQYIEENLLKIDRLLKNSETAIKLMQERRTALISSAVTGKIDVRNWQKPQEA